MKTTHDAVLAQLKRDLAEAEDALEIFEETADPNSIARWQRYNRAVLAQDSAAAFVGVRPAKALTPAEQIAEERASLRRAVLVAEARLQGAQRVLDAAPPRPPQGSWSEPQADQEPWPGIPQAFRIVFR